MTRTPVAALWCKSYDAGDMPVTTQQQPYGQLPDGTPIEQFTLGSGWMEVDLITYGATLTAIRVPDREGRPGNVTLALPNLEAYLGKNYYLGAVCGRYANRIAGGKFSLDGQEYALPINNGPNSLHGGLQGFNRKVWQATQIEDGVELSYLSPDGEEGYPGNLAVTVRYILSSENELWIEYRATTDHPTVVNLTNHAYFNLAGRGDVLGHGLELFAEQYTPVDATQIPTGALAPVEGTPFDFRTPHTIGERIHEPYPQLLIGKGYDHNFVLGQPRTMKLAARVTEPVSGRGMETLTTEPGIQFYSGNFMTGELMGASGEPLNQYSGFCLETQHYPDSPNQPQFPSTVLRPGETYHSITLYRFFAD
jgi:aldose 1-epimerase